MSASLRLCCVLVGWLLGVTLGTGWAGVEEKVPVAPQVKDLTITATSPFDRLPQTGYAPLEIKINNASAQSRRWDFIANSYTWGARRMTVGSRFTLGVEPGTARSFHILAPLSSTAVQLRVSGPEVIPSVVGFPGSNSKPNDTPFLGLSESLATAHSGGLETEAHNRGVELAWTRFTIAGAPEDWRGLAGFDFIWLVPEDLAALSPEQRNALRDWMFRGGALVLSGGEKPADFAEAGLGELVMEKPASEFKVSDALAQLTRRVPRSLWFGPDYKKGWGMYESLGEFHPNVALLTLLLIAFALVVGPVNLYVFAGSHRRSRLLWTTPVISLTASVVIVLLIVLRDGFGGEGERAAIIHLLPGERKAAVVQEQFSRAGVLTHADFQTESDALLVPILPDEIGPRTNHDYWINGRQFSGDWFNSRSAQAQWLETVVPSRAEVRLLNAKEMNEDGAAPAIVSSVDVTLEEFFYVAGSKYWYADKVKTGERTTLGPAERLPQSFFPGAGTRLKSLENLTRRPGHFFAFTSANSAFQETLRSIRWNKQRALYLGPVTEEEK